MGEWGGEDVEVSTVVQKKSSSKAKGGQRERQKGSEIEKERRKQERIGRR